MSSGADTHVAPPGAGSNGQDLSEVDNDSIAPEVFEDEGSEGGKKFDSMEPPEEEILLDDQTQSSAHVSSQSQAVPPGTSSHQPDASTPCGNSPDETPTAEGSKQAEDLPPDFFQHDKPKHEDDATYNSRTTVEYVQPFYRDDDYDEEDFEDESEEESEEEFQDDRIDDDMSSLGNDDELTSDDEEEVFKDVGRRSWFGRNRGGGGGGDGVFKNKDETEPLETEEQKEYKRRRAAFLRLKRRSDEKQKARHAAEMEERRRRRKRCMSWCCCCICWFIILILLVMLVLWLIPYEEEPPLHTDDDNENPDDDWVPFRPYDGIVTTPMDPYEEEDCDFSDDVFPHVYVFAQSLK